MEISYKGMQEAIMAGYPVYVIINGERYTLTGNDSRTAAAPEKCTN